jgi:hypothetical protein
MGRVKEVLIELDNDREAVITLRGLTIGELQLSLNDIEQTLQVIRYLREIRPFESLADIAAASYPGLQLAEPTVETEVVLPRAENRSRK